MCKEHRTSDSWQLSRESIPTELESSCQQCIKTVTYLSLFLYLLMLFRPSDLDANIINIPPSPCALFSAFLVPLLAFLSRFAGAIVSARQPCDRSTVYLHFHTFQRKEGNEGTDREMTTLPSSSWSQGEYLSSQTRSNLVLHQTKAGTQLSNTCTLGVLITCWKRSAFPIT